MKGDKEIMSEILVAGGDGSKDGLAARLIRFLSNKGTLEEKKGA